MNRTFQWLLLLAGAIGLLTKSVDAQTNRPNFIFLLTDDIGWGDIGVYGNKQVKTPKIDSLAARGIRFRNAYVTTSSCSPSRSSIITGRYPHNTGAPELHDTVPGNQILFPALMKDAGYYTLLSGKNHMGPAVRKAFHYVDQGQGPGGQEGWVRLLQQRPEEQPFFFWLSAIDAHRDWQINDKGAIHNPDSIVVPPMMYDGPRTRLDIASYYHEISRTDYYLGELIKELEAQGILESTYIVFTSDNGSPFPRNKTRLYDSGVKVPLLISGPGISAQTSGSLISSIDFAPTFLELAGISKGTDMQGVSFVAVFRDSTLKVRDFVFTEHNWHVFKAHERMVRYKNWVYIRNAYPERKNLAGESTRVFPAGDELWDAYENGRTRPIQEDIFLQPRKAEELYELGRDPHQFYNLAEKRKYRKTLAYLSNVLDQWTEETGDSQPLQQTTDREDVHGKVLAQPWIKGDKPGASRAAEKEKRPGPIKEADTRGQ